jgi:hypothetical protein
MAAYVRNFSVLGGSHSSTLTIDLGRSRSFVAFGTVTMIDSRNDFDADNAVALDILDVDGIRAPWLYGGAHFGDNGAVSNFHLPAREGYGQRITFRLRSFNPSDLDLAASAIVITEP